MRLHVLALLPLAPAALGCAGTVSGADSVDAEAASTTTAVVSVERTTDSSDGSRAQASARFIRVAAPASADDALRAIGAALDLPARGACASVSSLAGGAAPAQPLPVVELVDVGAVTLETGGVETHLIPRQLPDVTDVVSGVVYARAADPILLPAAARYVVHVAGTPQTGVGAFDLTATAPGDPAEVRVSGEGPAGTLVVSGASIDVTSAPDVGDDLVYVDVRPNGVRCALDDAGHAAVSTVFFDDAGTLVVHRLHREALAARGIDSGEVRFDFARTLAYVRR